MSIYSVINLLSVVIHTTLGLYVLVKGRRRALNQSFSLVAFSIAFTALGYFMLLTGSVWVGWILIVLMGQCLTHANIILLSLIYGRENYRDSLRKGKYYLGLIYGLALILIIASLSGILSVRFMIEHPYV